MARAIKPAKMSDDFMLSVCCFGIDLRTTRSDQDDEQVWIECLMREKGKESRVGLDLLI